MAQTIKVDWSGDKEHQCSICDSTEDYLLGLDGDVVRLCLRKPNTEDVVLSIMGSKEKMATMARHLIKFIEVVK